MSEDKITMGELGDQHPPRFPTMLRKMWSGGEVQDWINEHWQYPACSGRILVNKVAFQSLPKIMRDDLLAESDD